MERIQKGDIVGRKSYNTDIYFKVTNFYKDPKGREQVNLKGIHTRLCANAPLEDLVKIEPGKFVDYLREDTKKTSEHMKRILARREQERKFFLNRTVKENGKDGKKKTSLKPSDHEDSESNVSHFNNIDGFDVPGSVLHLDGDSDYLDLCLTTYKQLSIPANGYEIKEELQPKAVVDLLKKHSPDLLVLTGHDGFIKGKVDFTDINNYYSSHYFVEAVKKARTYEKSRDDLIIFAGACQSHYEAILSAGANFASSPQRVMIHAYDPVFVVEKIAYTSIYDPISIRDIIKDTITGFDGIGGLESLGKFRMGIPKSPY